MCRNCAIVHRFHANTSFTPPSRFSFPGVNRRQFLTAGLLGAAGLAAAVPARMARATDEAQGPASVVFRGGRVYTLEAERPWAEAVAVRGRSIVAVGSNADVEPFIGPGTRVIELDGRMMLPGFVEAHIHPTLGSFFTGGLDLQVPSRNDALAAIARYAKENPSGLVRGFGWRADMFPPEGPTRADLDRIIPDRPAFFFNIDVHSLWMNSKAIEAAGITRDTPDPVPGFSYFKRDTTGELTGYVLETPAVMAVVEKLAPITYESMKGWLQEWLGKASAAGITTVFDTGAMPLDGDQLNTFGLYIDLERQQRLPLRVKACYMVSKPDIEREVERAIELRSRVSTELVQVSALKIIGDGTAEGYTAVLLDPYSDKPETVVKAPYGREQLQAMVSRADAAGLDVHIHAFGDGLTRMALDAIEAAMGANPPRDRRHSLAHLVYVDDADIARFGKLGVVAQLSANWMSADPDTTRILPQRLGERARRMVRPKAVLDAGGIVAFGTDWPAAGYYSTYKPLESIQVAITRQLLDDPAAPVLEPADERLSLEQAIRANTMGGAYQLRMEDQIGSIRAGKLADLVVLRKNLFEVGKHEVASVPVDMTMMNGRFTYEAAA